MKLTQLTENFVISNDEFEDYLNRSTEQLKQELESGKNARDAIHDLALTFSNQHNKSYEAYERMTDSLAARMHTLELGQPTSDMPAMDNPEMDPEAPSDMDMTPDEPMDMDTPDAEEMPDEQEMADYDAVMNNKEEGVEESQSTSLKDKEDYIAKKKALQDIQMGEMDEELKKEVMRRKAELEDQAKKMGIKEEPETTMSIPAREVPLAGDSIWDKEGNNPKSVKVSQIEVENPFEPGGFLDGDEDDGYRKISVTHDGPWTIYTDSGFAKAISKMVKMNVDFTEQGMQKDGLADMETTQPYGKMESEVREYRMGYSDADKLGRENASKIDNELRRTVADSGKDIRDVLPGDLDELRYKIAKKMGLVEAEENTYTVVHAKHGKEEIKAKTTYEAAKKYAEMKKLKGTSGVDAHLHTEESVMIEEGAMDTLKKIVADKQNMPVKFDDGQMKVDLFTASAVTQVYDKVNDANKEKIDNMLKTKAGMLKIADFAMGAMKEGRITIQNPLSDAYSYGKDAPGKGASLSGAISGGIKKVKDKVGQAKDKVDQTIDKAKNSKVGKAISDPKTQAGARIVGRAAKAGLKGLANFTKDELNKVTGGQLGKKKIFNSDDYAEDLVSRSARLTMSEYNEFYKELDKAAKDGKKAGDSITVGGKNIKLKSDPKRMSDLKDSDMDKIDALAQRIYELNQK